MNPFRQEIIHSLLSTARNRPLTGLEIRAARAAKRAVATGRMGRSKYTPSR